MTRYKFSSINPNTNKKNTFIVEAKSLKEAERKAALTNNSHTGLRLEKRIADDSLEGRPVTGLAQMLKF